MAQRPTDYKMPASLLESIESARSFVGPQLPNLWEDLTAEQQAEILTLASPVEEGLKRLITLTQVAWEQTQVQRWQRVSAKLAEINEDESTED